MAKRRQFTDAQRRRIARYHSRHGHQATLAKYGIVSSVLHRCVADARLAPRYVEPPSKARADGKAKANGLEAVTLLRQAWRLIQAERGGALSDADLYVKLALNHLTQARKDA